MMDANKEKLLKLIAAGHDCEAAAHALGIDAAALSDPDLKKSIQEAHRVATARLKSKIMQLALDSDDARSLLQLLERREAMAVDDKVTGIERVIVDAICAHCGRPTGPKVARSVIQGELEPPKSESVTEASIPGNGAEMATVRRSYS
jgi:hypothetical protein